MCRSRRGAKSAHIPTVMSTAPISGIIFHAHDAGIPTTAK